jgi:hypothetical protein
MSTDLSKIRRYELKYTITESLAKEIKDYIQPMCSLDEHCLPGEQAYVVNNLYFDTPDLTFYYDTRHRKLTRYKARARYYGMQACDFVWPEIKYKHGSIVWKKRHAVPIDKWPLLFQVQPSERQQPLIKEQLDTFEEIIFWYKANSILHVRYIREPYVNDLEDYGRITFDRQLCYRLTHGSIDLSYNESDMIYYDDAITTIEFESPVLLEIKVETNVPYWAIELIRKFNLIQRPFSKYCYGIDNCLGFISPGRNSIFT